MKTKIIKKKKISSKFSRKDSKNGKSSLKNKKRTLTLNTLRGGSRVSKRIKSIGHQSSIIISRPPIPSSINRNWHQISQEPFILQLPIILPEIESLSYIEITNSLFQVNYNGLFILINLDLLSVDKLQYYINKAKLIRFSNDNNFLGLTENTIVFKSLNKGGMSQYRTGKSNNFIDIYEDITIPMIPYEENLRNLENPDYRKFYSNVKTIEKPTLKTIANEDIDWLYKIMISLNKKHSESKNNSNLEFFLEQFKLGQITKETKIFNKDDKDDNDCVDLNVDHTKLIIEDSNDDGTLLIDIDGNQYVIIGYPDQKMRSYLDLLKKRENEKVFEEIYNDHKSYFMKYISQLHNFIYDKQTNPSPLKHIDINKLEEEIHKFYGYDDYYKYIENFYENELLKSLTPEQIKEFKTTGFPKNAEYGIPYDPKFQEDFKKLQKAFYNELANKCLNKPMMKINYVFLILKKHTDGTYVPALFNIRELIHKYHPILERLEELIKKRLSQIYCITAKNETDYKLWYSHYNYGDVFHIKTEYIHTMSNIHQQAYKYKNSISLEELIYMLSIRDVDLINLRIDYQRKDNRFSVVNGINLEKIYDEENKNKVKKKLISKCNVDKKIYEKPKHNQLSNILVLLNINTKILLMFVETGNSYTFVYKSGIDNNFYIIKIKPNLCNISIKLFNYLNNNNIFNLFYREFTSKNKIDLIKSFNIEEDLQLYEIEFNRPINSEDYEKIMRYNPLLVRTIKQQNTAVKLTSICLFFQTQILEKKEFICNDIEIPNPYIKKPFLIRNILATEIYKREFEIFKSKISQNNFYHAYRPKETDDPYYKSEYDNDIIDILDDKYLYSLYEGLENNKRKLNRIYFNPNNCGYTLIDICEKLEFGEFKSVIWVVPLNATFNETMNEEYDNIFLKVKYIGNYIGNFIYLNNNHINMINQVKKRYFIKETFCNVNIQSKSPSNFCLHFHILKKIEYKSKFSYFEQGSRIYAMLDLNTILNNINLFNEYYNLLDINIILHNDN